MNKKGFTLIELLGVIVIIGLLILLALPKIVNSTYNASSKTDKLIEDMVYKSTKLYIKDNSLEFQKIVGKTYCVTISELVDGNYIESPVKIKDEDITYSYSVKIIYNDKYNFELVKNADCIK